MQCHREEVFGMDLDVLIDWFAMKHPKGMTLI